MHSLHALICWLNRNAGTVSTLATVVIAYASWISSRIIRLQKQIEHANRMPVLTFVERVQTDWRSVFVKNAGYGPALNIVRKVVKTVERIPGIEPNECLTIGALGSADEAPAIITTKSGDSSTSLLDEPELWIVAECDDILGAHYEVTYKNRSHSIRPIRQRNMLPDRAARI